MHDLVRDAMLKMIAKGMTPLEAFREFNAEEFHKAMFASLEEGDRSLLELSAAASREECDEAAMAQAIELWMAGWTSEVPRGTGMVMSWYWRAPAKPGRKVGRRYLSTNQAWNKLKRGSV